MHEMDQINIKEPEFPRCVNLEEGEKRRLESLDSVGTLCLFVLNNRDLLMR